MVMQTPEVANEFVRYDFSDQELADIAKTMAQKVSELKTAEDERKAVASEFKSRLDSLQADVNRAATKLNNGYEMRHMDVHVVRDYEVKEIRYYRPDTTKCVKTVRMSADDLQQQLDFEQNRKVIID